MRRHLPVLAALAALALAGCGEQTDGADGSAPTDLEAVDDTAPAVPPPPEPQVGNGNDPGAAGPTAPAIAVDDGDLRRFDCESGHTVELVGEDLARVTLADGRVIELPRKSNGIAEYRGEALSFDLDDSGRGGVLGQDEVGGFACEPAG